MGRRKVQGQSLDEMSEKLDADSQRGALERENHKLKKQVASLQRDKRNLMDELDDWEKRSEFWELTNGKVKVTDFKPLKAKPGESTAIVVMTDWHVEQTIDPDTVSGLNAYSLEIADRRIMRAFQKSAEMLDWTRGWADVQDIVLALLGDFINGYLRNEDMETNSLSPIEACEFAKERVVSGIEFLLKETKLRLVCPTCIGNHGRTTPKWQSGSAAKNSYEYWLYVQLAKLYANHPRVRFKVVKSYHNFLDVQGHVMRFHHGNAIRFLGGTGGLTIPANKKVGKWDRMYRQFAQDVFGHHHCFFNAFEFTACGSTQGATAYAVENAFEAQPASQTLMVMSRKYGKVLATPIFVEG